MSAEVRLAQQSAQNAAKRSRLDFLQRCRRCVEGFGIWGWLAKMRARYTSATSLKLACARCLPIVVAVVLASCSTVQHSYQIGDVVGRSLSTATEAGELRLALESEYDFAVRDIVARKGRPEWLHIVSRDQLYLYFTSRDEVVVITRPMVPPGEVRVYERTPGFLLSLLPKTVVDATLAERRGRARTRKAASTSAARARRSPHRSPARIAPRQADNSMSFQNFDPGLIVTRLRTPLSAADPGVTQWRHGRVRDGKPAQFATSGTTRYVVRSEAITVTVPTSSRGDTATANHAIHRVNQAVFGTRANAIGRQLEPMVSRVTSDTSGRTRIRQRIGGRTVSVIRDTKRRLLVYSVLSE